MPIKDYTIFEVQGKDAITMMNNLSTNLIQKYNKKNMIYSCILTPNGRFMYDYFFIENGLNSFVAVNKNFADGFISYINMFKMDAEVTFLSTNLLLNWSKNLEDYQDPRNPLIGFWSIVKNSDNDDSQTYHFHRMNLKIADGYYDLTQKESVILDYGFDNLNAINYTKGCYLGQELIARTHHTGVIRKNVYHFKCTKLLTKGTDILQDNRKVGKVLGGFVDNYLALIKFDDVDFSQNITVENYSFLIN